MPWEKVDITWGDTSRNLPWSCVSGGSQTTHAMTRAAHAAASDAIKKLQQIAAKDLGGRPEDYVVANERVSRKGGGAGMTLAHAAQRAIELGGIYDGHEVPKEINAFTKRSAAALAGQGLMGVARDAYPHDGNSLSFVASFAEVEVDVETGVYRIRRLSLPSPTSGPSSIQRRWAARCSAARCWVSAMPSARSGCTTSTMAWRWPKVLSEQTAHDPRRAGAHGLGGGRTSGSGDAGWRTRHRRASGRGRLRAVLNAISAAVGDEVFVRAPVTLDHIVTALEVGRPTQARLTANV